MPRTPIIHTLFRGDYALELSLDDATRCFTVTCQPPSALDQPEVQKATHEWCARVARGYARRHRQGDHADVKLLPTKETGRLFGQIIISAEA